MRLSRGEIYVDPDARVDRTAIIGAGTKIWAFAVISRGARLGEQCVVGTHTFIGNDAVIGDRVRMMGQSYIPTQIRIGNDVFIGPGAIFTGDKYPVVNKPNHKENPVIVEDGVSVGAGVIVLPGVVLGQGCRIGAGSVVTRNVPPGVLVVGNPARLPRDGGPRMANGDKAVSPQNIPTARYYTAAQVNAQFDADIQVIAPNCENVPCLQGL